MWVNFSGESCNCSSYALKGNADSKTSKSLARCKSLEGGNSILFVYYWV